MDRRPSVRRHRDFDPEWSGLAVEAVALGVSNTAYAEVVAGLEPGDRVIFASEGLPTPNLGLPDPKTRLDLALQRKPSGR